MRAHPSAGFGRPPGPPPRDREGRRPHAPEPGPSSFLSEERAQLAFLLLFASTIFFAKLGMNGMANFDDCFYAQKAKEALLDGNWLVQSFNHQPQFGNAPLHIWLVALSYKVFGITVFAAKFPSALMALGTVLLTYFLGRSLFNAWTGFAAGVILSTTYTFFKYARHCMLDATLAFFCTLALASFVLAMRKDRSWLWLWGAALGAAFLTKSALGLFPLLVTLLFILLDRQWKVLAWPSFWGGLALEGSVIGLWCWTQYRADAPRFLEEHLRGVILDKFYLGEAPAWYQHFSFLVDMATFNWLWLPLFAWGLWRLGRKVGTRHSTALFLLLWCLTLPVCMSLVHYRMPWYLLQVFPALALAAASALGETVPEGTRRKWTRCFLIGGFFFCVILNFQPRALDGDRERDTRVLAPYVKHFADRGAKVVGFRDDFYGMNNAMLFFSDHAAQPLYAKGEEVARAFGGPGTVLCVAHRGDLPEIQRTVREWYPVKYGEDLVLFSNQKLDTHEVRTWGKPWN